MQINAHGITDRGLVRPTNEDALFINTEHNVYAVADGLGGLPGGAESSARIVELLQKTFSKVDVKEEQMDLAELIIGINRILTAEGHDAHPFTGYGSTLTIAQIIKDQLLVAHIGDSAIYHLRNESLKQITIDHTMEQELLDRMGESARDIMPPEYPHSLTRCVGQQEDIRVDQTRLTLEPHDRLVLCTDGLNKVLTDRQIQYLLEADETPEVIAQSLVDSANANEGPDNITLIVLIIE